MKHTLLDYHTLAPPLNAALRYKEEGSEGEEAEEEKEEEEDRKKNQGLSDYF